MSDYIHKKVVRLPFPKEIMHKCKVDSVDNCESYLKELLGEFWDPRDGKGFQLEFTDEGYYIDWVYYYTYGYESGYFGFVRLLTQKELDVIKPYFNKLEIDYKDEDLRVVNYCYYNSCEAPDYYSIENIDDSDLFIDKTT